MTGPLAGVNVVDLGTAYVGPWAATLLGYLGANVIKIESPSGDRHHNQKPHQRGVATTYTSVNLNKRAAIVDVKDPATHPAIDRLTGRRGRAGQAAPRPTASGAGPRRPTGRAPIRPRSPELSS